MKKTLLIAAGGLALAVAGGLVYWRTSSSQETAALRRGPIVEAVYGLGTVTAQRTFHLKLGITTGVKKLYVKEGDRVNAGQTLITFDEGSSQKAPFSGLVTGVYFKEGENVSPQVTVLSMVDLSERYISVSLEQQGALRVRPGQQVHASLESLRAEKFSGTVESIYPSEGQFMVRINVPSLPPEVLPGMTADVAIEVAHRDDALLLPVTALGAGQVVRVRGHRREKVPVKVGTVDGEWAEVVGGDLSVDDIVLVRRR